MFDVFVSVGAGNRTCLGGFTDAEPDCDGALARAIVRSQFQRGICVLYENHALKKKEMFDLRSLFSHICSRRATTISLLPTQGSLMKGFEVWCLTVRKSVDESIKVPALPRHAYCQSVSRTMFDLFTIGLTEEVLHPMSVSNSG